MTSYHPELKKRINQFPIESQILMICNELNRAMKQSDDKVECLNCLYRAQEILDFSRSETKGIFLSKEINRAREFLAMLTLYPNKEKINSLQQALIRLHPKNYLALNKPET